MQEIFEETSTEASPERVEEVKVASPPGLRKRPVYVNTFVNIVCHVLMDQVSYRNVLRLS